MSYPKDVAAFIQEHAHEGSVHEITRRVNETFGTSYAEKRIKWYMTSHHLHTARRGDPHPITPEIESFIFTHLQGTGATKMASLVNKAFGTAYTVGQMIYYYHKHGLKSGLTAYSLFGDTTCPVGTIHMRKYAPSGYFYQKVAEPNVWRAKHILEWEAHNGPIPKGYHIKFVNGNTLDWNIENLTIETNAQHLVKSRLGLHGYNKESEEVANKIADLRVAANRAQRKGKDK